MEARVVAEVAGQRTVGVDVEQQGAETPGGKQPAQANGGGGLADPPF